MLQIITAEVQLTKSGERPPSCQEEQVILVQSSIFEVDVDQSLTQSAEYYTQTVAYVTVAEVQSSQ